MPESKLSEETNILKKLEKLCGYLSTESLTITFNPEGKSEIPEHTDVKLKFKLKGSKKAYPVTLYINVGHVSMRQGSDYVG